MASFLRHAKCDEKALELSDTIDFSCFTDLHHARSMVVIFPDVPRASQKSYYDFNVCNIFCCVGEFCFLWLILNFGRREGIVAKNGSVIGSLSDQLRRDISLGVLKPGIKLNIEALKRKFDVSHPSVREALSLLVGEGYVSFEEMKGFRVLTSSQNEVMDGRRVRAELEALAFEWAVQRTTVDWRSSVVAAHYALSEVERKMPVDPFDAVLEWDDRNKNFHLAIAANSGSPKVIELISVQYDQSRRYRLMAHANERSEAARSRWVAKSAQEHDALKEAVLSGDIKAGCAILRGHITEATLQVIKDVDMSFEGLKQPS